MTSAKLESLLNFYSELLSYQVVYPQELSENQKATSFDCVGTLNRRRHVLWMCHDAKQFIYDGRTDKAMRWLGFIQGYLACEYGFSLEDLKTHSRPETVLRDGKWVMEESP